MIHNGTRKLLDYWTEIRGSALAPARADISPASISSILPSTFILETDRHDEFQFRLAGTALCTLYNEELKKLSFCALLDIDERKLMRRLLKAASSEKTGLLMTFDALVNAEKRVALEVLILPLSDEQPRMVGALHALELPYWLGAETIVSTTIKSIRVLDAEKELFALQNRPSIPLEKRLHAMATRPPSSRFAVLQGGAMLGGPQLQQPNNISKRTKFNVVEGGRK